MNVCADPFAGLDMDFGMNDVGCCSGEIEAERPTQPSLVVSPPIGSAKLTVVDEPVALFFSATWTLVARVNGKEISRSTESGKAHSQAFIKRWTRQVIRTQYESLRELGVDTDAEYVKWGGLLEDLDSP